MEDNFYLPLVIILISLVTGGLSLIAAFCCGLYGNINYEYGDDDIRLKRAKFGLFLSLMLLVISAAFFLGSLGTIAILMC